MGSILAATTFLSTLPAWGATNGWQKASSKVLFLSTLPAWGATYTVLPLYLALPHFYPRSPRGERRAAGVCGNRHVSDFYPRSPRGERPGPLAPASGSGQISIHAPRVGSDSLGSVTWAISGTISIHAPRVGSDCGAQRPANGTPTISIHAPRVGSDSKNRQK